jgi:hypothetical protein
LSDAKQPQRRLGELAVRGGQQDACRRAAAYLKVYRAQELEDFRR